MKNKKQLNKALYMLITLFSFIILSTNIEAYAEDKNNKNIDLIILFNNNAIDKNVETIINNSGGKIINKFSEIGGMEVKCDPSLIPIIKAKDSIQSLAPNHIIKLSDEKNKKIKESAYKDDSNIIPGDLYEEYQWDIKRVTNNGKSFEIETGNHNVVVGIVDSGIDANHPDLINNFLGGKNLVPKGFNDDFETGDPNDLNDRLGHGTNVAGIIAANGRIKGVAPNIGFKSYRIFNENGETNATICASAIMAAVNDGVKVINLSISSYDLKGKCYWTDPDTGIEHKLGSDMAEYSLLKRAIKYAVNNGITVVAAAGNENKNCADRKDLTNYLNERYGKDGFRYEGLTYQAPGTIKGVLTVSAVGRNDKLASYSNYGEKFVDISAPGGDISITDDLKDMCFTTDISSEYIFTEGTSIATPKVSAAAALIICRDENIKPKEVCKKLYKTADELEDGNASEYYGAGMVNAYKAIK